MVKRCAELLSKLPDTVIMPEAEEYAVYEHAEDERFTVRKEGNIYYVEGAWATKLVNSINIYNTESLRYFQRQLREKNVIEELEKAGIQEEDLVVIDDFEFEYFR